MKLEDRNTKRKVLTRLAVKAMLVIALYFGIVMWFAPDWWLGIGALALLCELGILGWWYGAQS